MFERKLMIIILALFIVFCAISSAGAEYVLRVDDRLYISVWGHSDLQQEVMIPPDGNISFPLVGEIEAAGRTREELSESLQYKLKEYIREPRVSITLQEYTRDRVMIMGEVNNPGSYYLSEEKTVLNAVSLAGGFTNIANLKNVSIRRGDRRLSVNLEEYLNDVSGARDPLLEDGDVVMVPDILLEASVLGHVQQPGRYQLEKGLRVSDLLAQAGSVQPGAGKEFTYISDGEVIKLDGEAVISGENEQNPILKEGDSLYIPESDYRVSILGEVNNPGSYEWEEDLNLAELLARAGNQSERGDITEIKILHRDGKHSEVNLAQYFNEKSVQHNPRLKRGDIVYIDEKSGVDVHEFFSIVSGLNTLKDFLQIEW